MIWWPEELNVLKLEVTSVLSAAQYSSVCMELEDGNLHSKGRHH